MRPHPVTSRRSVVLGVAAVALLAAVGCAGPTPVPSPPPDVVAPSASPTLEPPGPPDPTPVGGCADRREPIDPAVLDDLGPDGALVCYGGDDLRIRGRLGCVTAAVDPSVGGASFLGGQAICLIDGVLRVSGDAVWDLLEDPVLAASGQVNVEAEVVAHYDDPESLQCFAVPFGVVVTTPVQPPEQAAVELCRRQLVASTVTPLD